MRAPSTNQQHVHPCPVDGMGKSTPATIRATCRDQFEPENLRAHKAENCGVLAPHMAQILGENTHMDSSRVALSLPELAALYGGNHRSARNWFYKHPEDFPPAIYLPGTRGPRFLVSDVPAWLDSRKTQQPAPPPSAPKPQGRPRKASASQIARARQGKVGVA